MKIEMTRTVGELAAESPVLIPLFENRRIDYCCGGKRSLKDACDLVGVDVVQVISDLKKKLADKANENGAAIQWSEKSMTELADHILKKHHVFTRETLVRLKKLAEKVNRVHGDRHPELEKIETIVNVMAEEMDGHMAKEEEMVFPYLKAVEAAGGKKESVLDPFRRDGMDCHPLKVLMWEHGMTGEEFLELHQLTNDFILPVGACGSYMALYEGLKELEADIHQHVHLENNVLFQKAMDAKLLD